MISGIYQIKNTLNGKCYIGSAVNIQRRWLWHLAALRRGGHHNRHLQSAFDKDDEEAFVFDVLEDVKPEMLIEREQYYLDRYSPEYNLSPTAGNCLGVQRTDEARARMRGKRNPNYGKHRSEATKQKISETLMGHQASDETKRKISKTTTGERNPMYGKHHSDETKRKISEARTGERNPNYGKTLSDETKRKISESQKARWRRVHEAKNR